MVHRNLLLPLLSDPLDRAGELDKSRSLADPKETMGTQVAIAASAIASHVHNLNAYEGVWRSLFISVTLTILVAGICLLN